MCTFGRAWDWFLKFTCTKHKRIEAVFWIGDFRRIYCCQHGNSLTLEHDDSCCINGRNIIISSCMISLAFVRTQFLLQSEPPYRWYIFHRILQFFRRYAFINKITFSTALFCSMSVIIDFNWASFTYLELIKVL